MAVRFPAALSLASLCLLSVLSAEAQYTRVVGGNPPKYDVSTPHPLSYWIDDPLASHADEEGDFTLYLGCKADSGHVITKSDYEVRSEVHHLGPLAGHAVIDIIDHVHSKLAEWPNDGVWHVVLAESRPGQFEEIYREERGIDEFASIKPSRIVKVGSEPILATFDPTSGTGTFCTEGYWWFDKSGPNPLIFEPVYRAIARKLPQGSDFHEGCWSINLDEQKIWTYAKTQEQAKRCNACGGIGDVIAHFVLHGAVAVPTKVEFNPDKNN